MPKLGTPEIILILVIILIFFGVGKLPQVGEALGKGIRSFRRASSGDDDKQAAKAVESQPVKEEKKD